nr:anaerobic ribonucleoside-triphosphate reductase activating protein [uncultured Aminipila sp.]
MMLQPEKWKKSSIRIAGIIRESIVDGPGIRFTIFCQGCPHKCEGCHNPETHDFKGGYDCSIEKILKEIDKNPLLAGVTFSGGDPMCQPGEFLTLAQEIKKRSLDIVIFSGYTFEELQIMAESNQSINDLLLLTDYLIDGKFMLAEKDLALNFRGSRNQRYIDMNLTRKVGHIVLAE